MKSRPSPVTAFIVTLPSALTRLVMAKILLIEDEPGLVLTATDLLTGEGYEVDAATDGDSGGL